MTQFLEFFALIIIISASGVMAPGPLFVANISYGLVGGLKAGLKMAVGHAIVELPIVVILGIGVFSLESFLGYRVIVTLMGAIALFVFAGIQIKVVFEKKNDFTTPAGKSPLIAGIILSGLNPFFLVWWITIGFKLVSDSILLWGAGGILILFGLHIWMDFAWLGGVAYLSSKGAKVLSNKNLKIIMFVLSLTLIYFGFSFLAEIYF